MIQLKLISKMQRRPAEKANKSDLVEILQTIKIDRKRHMHLLKEALEKEIHG
jgi:hypothetical protein